MFLEESHVPSPTDIVPEEYELLPGGASCGEGDILVDDWRRSLDLHSEESVHATAQDFVGCQPWVS